MSAGETCKFRRPLANDMRNGEFGFELDSLSPCSERASGTGSGSVFNCDFMIFSSSASSDTLSLSAEGGVCRAGLGVEDDEGAVESWRVEAVAVVVGLNALPS